MFLRQEYAPPRLARARCRGVCSIPSSPALVVLVLIQTHLRPCARRIAADFSGKQSLTTIGRRKFPAPSFIHCVGTRCVCSHFSTDPTTMVPRKNTWIGSLPGTLKRDATICFIVGLAIVCAPFAWPNNAASPQLSRFRPGIATARKQRLKSRTPLRRLATFPRFKNGKQDCYSTGSVLSKSTALPTCW